jgi:hypothetical protein
MRKKRRNTGTRSLAPNPNVVPPFQNPFTPVRLHCGIPSLVPQPSASSMGGICCPLASVISRYSPTFFLEGGGLERAPVPALDVCSSHYSPLYQRSIRQRWDYQHFWDTAGIFQLSVQSLAPHSTANRCLFHSTAHARLMGCYLASFNYQSLRCGARSSILYPFL